MNYNEILNKAFNEMPTTFTSAQFNRAALKNGYPEQILANRQGLSTYLVKHATSEGKYSKTWTKNNHSVSLNDLFDLKLNENEITIINEIVKDSEWTIEQHIYFLKSKGYKVLKPVNEFVEC